MSPATLQRIAGWALLSLGTAVLAVSYAVVCQRTGSLWPWTRVVHEDGIRTLLATVLYFEHGARELLLDLVLGVAVGGCLLFAFPPAARKVRGEDLTPGATGLGFAFALSISVILVGAVVDVGLTGLRDNLLQYHTRPFAALEWGSHWRYHLLSRLALILGSLGLAGALRLWTGAADEGTARRGLAVVGGSLVAYAAFTVIFSNGLRAFILPVVDPVYLGHQAREFATHVLATLPIAWGVGLLVVRPAWAPRADGGARIVAWPLTVASGAAGVVLGLYICLAALSKDSASQGQTDDLAMLIFPHFFEHIQTYVVVTVLALFVYKLASKTRST